MNIEKEYTPNERINKNDFLGGLKEIKLKIESLIKDGFTLDNLKNTTRLSIFSILGIIASSNIAQAEHNINGIVSHPNPENVAYFNLCHSNQSSKDVNKWTCENIGKDSDPLNPGYFKGSISGVPNEDSFLAFQAVDNNGIASGLSNPLQLQTSTSPIIQNVKYN